MLVTFFPRRESRSVNDQYTMAFSIDLFSYHESRPAGFNFSNQTFLLKSFAESRSCHRELIAGLGPKSFCHGIAHIRQEIDMSSVYPADALAFVFRFIIAPDPLARICRFPIRDDLLQIGAAAGDCILQEVQETLCGFGFLLVLGLDTCQKQKRIPCPLPLVMRFCFWRGTGLPGKDKKISPTQCQARGIASGASMLVTPGGRLPQFCYFILQVSLYLGIVRGKPLDEGGKCLGVRRIESILLADCELIKVHGVGFHIDQEHASLKALTFGAVFPCWNNESTWGFGRS